MPKAPLPAQFGGNPPWHMWGTTAILTPTSTPSLGNTATKQLARINYKRPETWSFFFGARVLDATVGAGVTLGVIVVFDLIIGVGRTMFNTTANAGAIGVGNLPAFARFRFDVTIPIVPLLNQPKWTTTGLSPLLDDSAPLVLPPAIQHFPAQDIQCTARAILMQVGTASVEVTSWFAPRSHVRPDWFQDAASAQYLGGEVGGT